MAKFIKFQTVADDGHSSSECSINAEEVIFLAPVSPFELVGKTTAATIITFRGGDRKIVLGSVESVACAIEEAVRVMPKKE